jgi:hypothetical protein
VPDLFLPAEERVKIIRDYAARYRIHKFIESGTSVGFTTDAVRDVFEQIYTIELDEKTYWAAVERFKNDKNVTCLIGDSGNLLHALVPSLNEPLLFWLDGHYCGGESRGEIDTPIVKELEAAVQAPRGSVILIDDARLFGGMPEHTEEFKDYPHVDWIFDLAFEWDFDWKLEDDIIRLTPLDV